VISNENRLTDHGQAVTMEFHRKANEYRFGFVSCFALYVKSPLMYFKNIDVERDVIPD
jgi:hypothetical protein